MGDDNVRKPKWTREQLHGGATMLNLQTGTNKFDSQKGMTAIGAIRLNITVTKEKGKKHEVEQDRKGEDIVRPQAGSNQYASQKQMTAIGAIRNTKLRYTLKEGQKLEADKASETMVPNQSGSNKYASQAGGEVVFFGKRNTSMFIRGKQGARDRRTEMFIPYQSGSNLYASQMGMHDPPGSGAFRKETTDIEGLNFTEEQLRKGDEYIRWQAGSNKFDSQKKTGGFNKVRDVLCKMWGGKEIPEDWLMASEGLVRLQSGTNKFDSQKNMTCMGARRMEINRPKWKQEWLEEWEVAEKEWEDSGRGKLVDKQKQEQYEKMRLETLSAASAANSDREDNTEATGASEPDTSEQE